MKNGLLLLASFILFTLGPVTMSASTPNTVEQLRKEVAQFFQQQDLAFLPQDVETVKVNFLINAKNEIVVFDVSGDHVETCDYVKNTLHFQKVNYKQSRQLQRYVVEIRLMKK